MRHDRSGLVNTPKRGDTQALVVRDNRLVRSSYWLTPPEKRFVYWMFWSYQQNGNREQVVSINELAQYCEIEGNSIYRTMYEVAHRLQGRVVVVWDVVEGAPSFVNFTEKITPNLGEGTIKVVLHSAIEPLLKDLHDNFTKTALETAVRLSSFYSMRLYDLAMCHQFRADGMLYSVEEIKAELGVLELTRKSKTEVEIRSDRYPIWKRFKEHVLDRAVKELNEKTDVVVTIEAIRSGKSVTHVRLRCHPNKRGEALAGLTERQGDLANLLMKAGMSPKEARKAVDAYGPTDPDRIVWHVQQSKQKNTPLAWLRAGLKKDYRPQGKLPFRPRGSDRSEQDRDRELRMRAAPPSSDRGMIKIGDVLGSARR